jgi:hypothetical protein
MELARGSSVEQDRSYRRESVKKTPFSAVTSALKPAENWDFWYSRVPSGLVQDPPVPPPDWSKISKKSLEGAGGTEPARCPTTRRRHVAQSPF